LQAFFVFVFTIINEFYVGFDGSNKRRKEEKDSSNDLGLLIRKFISSLK
jgi:hypothetical protein